MNTELLIERANEKYKDDARLAGLDFIEITLTALKDHAELVVVPIETAAVLCFLLENLMLKNKS